MFRALEYDLIQLYNLETLLSMEHDCNYLCLTFPYFVIDIICNLLFFQFSEKIIYYMVGGIIPNSLIFVFTSSGIFITALEISLYIFYTFFSSNIIFL